MYIGDTATAAAASPHPVFLVIVVIGLVVARRTVGGPRAARCPQHVLRPILLRMDRYALGHGTVTAPSLGEWPVSWKVPNRARPIAMDSSCRAVLGGTAGDGQIAVPLDAELGLAELITRGRSRRRSEERRVGKECRSRWSPYH